MASGESDSLRLPCGIRAINDTATEQYTHDKIELLTEAHEIKGFNQAECVDYKNAGTSFDDFGGKSLSRELTITEPGDEVTIEFYASGEKEVPMYKFDNLSIVLVGTEAQGEVTQKAFERKEEQRSVVNSGTTKARINNITPEELQQLEKYITLKE